MGSTVLLVANRTADTDRLREVVAQRASHGADAFHLVVPAVPHGLHRVVDPEVAGWEEAQAALVLALPSLSEAAGCEVSGEVGSADPLAAIQDALARRDLDEIIVSTLPRRVSRWLRLDLPSKAGGLGLPVTHVEAARVPEPILAVNQ
ncbi:MAG: hypothetical protein ACR2K3_04930 [Nocardioides sp.]